MPPIPMTVNRTITPSSALFRGPPPRLRRSRVRWERLIRGRCEERSSVGRDRPSPGMPGTLARARGIATFSGAQAAQDALAQVGLRARPLARRDALPADRDADPLRGGLRDRDALGLFAHCLESAREILVEREPD